LQSTIYVKKQTSALDKDYNLCMAATRWIEARCQEVSSSNHLTQRAATAISNAILSPITFDNSTSFTFTTTTNNNNSSSSSQIISTTEVDQKRRNLAQLVDSIQNLLQQIQNIQPNPSQQTIEVIRHTSYLCSKLPSVEEDECLILYFSLARITLPPQLYPSGWLHEDYLSVVPVHLFPFQERLALCSVYPSVWRRYVRHLLQEIQELLKNETIDEKDSIQNIVEKYASKIIPSTNDGGWELYMKHPLLHLMATHFIQITYIGSNESDEHCNAMIRLMVRLRQLLTINLNSYRLLESSVPTTIDTYIFNGEWLKKVTASLIIGTTNDYNVNTLKNVVAEIQVAINNDGSNVDGMKEKLNAIWLYLLQWNDYIDYVTSNDGQTDINNKSMVTESQKLLYYSRTTGY
jgi:hypothetical protein